ncbi:hypothetical protein DRO69_13415 [Candidatus Bathyarchaeota archaeon]|nr:MAG: hypothetical protein DRO69_13415 [Candidatus Bathyarchaeota archaeon]
MKKLIMFLIIMLMLSMIPFNAMVQAEIQTNLKIHPQENIFYTNTTSVGETFEISVIAENIPEDNGMYGWEIVLNWNPNAINCTGEEINFGVWPAFLGPWVTDPIDNDNGEYHQSLTARYPSEPVNGTYWLVNLTFVITQEPSPGATITSDLDLNPAEGYIYCLVNFDGEEIPHNFVNGVYHYISPRPPTEEIKLAIVPSAIINPSLVPCENFTINVTVADALYLHGYSFKIGYNATVIECTDVQEGEFLQSFGSTDFFYNIDNELGEIYLSSNLTSPEAMANGTGTLATLTFHVKAIGESRIQLYDTNLYDPQLQPLPHSIENGYFNNILMPVIYVDPPMIIDPEMKPADEFEVKINVANVSNLYDFEFTLYYDTNVLSCLGIIVYPFTNTTTFEIEFNLNDTEGKLWVRVQYLPPAEPLDAISPTTLAKIFFQVQSYGATVLDLSGTKLSDYYGNQLDHISRDGFVSVLRRDLAVIEIVPEFIEIYKGWTIQINVTVANLGDITESFNVSLFCNDHEVGKQEILNLESNATATTTFTLETAVYAWLEPCHNYTLKAEVLPVPYELNVTNNILEDGQIHIKLMGDINGDRYVDARDAIVVGYSFGTKIGDPEWNPYADLNQDGYVNAKDVIIMGLNFGAHC